MANANFRPRLFCFGLGYSASRLARKLADQGWDIAGTCRSPEGVAELCEQGFDAFLFDGERPLEDAETVLKETTHLLNSVPPDATDPVLALHRQDVIDIKGLRWAGYLSTTGVYGDTGGAVVNETATLKPTSEHGLRRVRAEEGWLGLHRDHGLPAHIFRLPGIYGPGRSALDQVRAGRARRILKPGHLFSRIHVDDIGNVVKASMALPHPGAIYNVADDEPASPADVTGFACEILGAAALPVIAFEEAAKDMSPMGLSFWQDNRRIDNARIKEDLGITLLYPSYREGLCAIKAEDEKGEA